MPTHGHGIHYKFFVFSTTNWQTYADQLNYYFIANEITTDIESCNFTFNLWTSYIQNNLQFGRRRHIKGYQI